MIGGGSKIMKRLVYTYSIPLSKESTIADLKRLTGEMAGLQPSKGTRLVIGNYRASSTNLTRKFLQNQSCYDIDPSANEDIIAYELRVDENEFRSRPEDFKAIEFIFMKPGKPLSNGSKNLVPADAVPRTIPRLEMLDVNMTLIEVKRYLFEKVKHIFPQEHAINRSEDVEAQNNVINKSIQLVVFDNLPMVKDAKLNYRVRATCEFCK
jgi:hypothetical protein